MSDIVDKKKADALLAKCRAALEQVLQAEGFELSKVSGKYGDSFGFSVSAIPSVRNEMGLNPNAPEVIGFHRYHALLNLDPGALGVEFKVGAKTYALQGLNLNRRKYPLVAKCAGKKLLLAAESRVIEAINTAAKTKAAGPTSPATRTAKPGR